MNKLVLIIALTMAGQVFAAGKMECASKGTMKPEAELKAAATAAATWKEPSAVKFAWDTKTHCYTAKGETTEGKHAEVMIDGVTAEVKTK